MITRFEPTMEVSVGSQRMFPSMEEDTHGDYVLYNDYVALAQRLTTLREALEQVQEILGDYSSTFAMLEE